MEDEVQYLPFAVTVQHDWGLPDITDTLKDWNWSDVRLPENYHRATQHSTPPRYFVDYMAQNPTRYLLQFDGMVDQDHFRNKGAPVSILYVQKLKEEWYWKRKVEKVFVPYFGVWRKHQHKKYHVWFNKTYDMERIKQILRTVGDDILRKLLSDSDLNQDTETIHQLEERIEDYGNGRNDEEGNGNEPLLAVYRKCGLASFPNGHYKFRLKDYEKERLLERAASYIFERRWWFNYSFHKAMDVRSMHDKYNNEIGRRESMTEEERNDREEKYPSYQSWHLQYDGEPPMEVCSDQHLRNTVDELAEIHDKELRKWMKDVGKPGRKHYLAMWKEFYELKPKWLTNTVNMVDSDDETEEGDSGNAAGQNEKENEGEYEADDDYNEDSDDSDNYDSTVNVYSYKTPPRKDHLYYGYT